MRKNVFFGLLGLMVLFGFIGCGGDDDPKIYKVTIGTLTNGSITANPTSGIEGTEITLTVNPNNLFSLKNKTLKYGTNDINQITKKFNLPASNVTITAEFEQIFNGVWIFSQNGVEQAKFTFSENDYFEQFLDTGEYASKGTWNIEQPNKLLINTTHERSTGHHFSLEDIPDIEDYTLEIIFEYVSDATYKITIVLNNREFICSKYFD